MQQAGLMVLVNEQIGSKPGSTFPAVRPPIVAIFERKPDNANR
jgi:hypothetical protein